jgi:hypothetical protein
MSSVRVEAAAAQLPNGILLVTGGFNGSFHNSAEMSTGDGWESKIPSLPVTIFAHCMVTVNTTTVMVIGGKQNGEDYSGKTFYFTLGEESWTEGPELKLRRFHHSCGKIRRDKDSEKMSIIVAGGEDGRVYFPIVEILDEGSDEWKTGPELPLSITASQMVEDQNGGAVLIGGFSSSYEAIDALYQLPHGGQDAAWTKMEQKLKIGRLHHPAFLVPDNIADCF